MFFINQATIAGGEVFIIWSVYKGQDIFY